jgi:alpha-ketoglutaric semialdehyde dehydrogenase
MSDSTQAQAGEQQVFAGVSIIAGKPVTGNHGVSTAVNPATNENLEPGYTLIDKEQLKEATRAAKEAFPSYSATDLDKRAAFLETAADNLDALGETLTERYMLESGLPRARAEGERGRTVNQLRMFAGVVRQGDFIGARVDPALPDRTPPRVDIRQRKVPLGPVAVFGASNFPLAFSTAGGDTASALAAGCPVVFKAHNAHPGVSELVGRAISDAVAEHGLHPGVFSLIYGPGRIVGQALVSDEAIRAVGFTGSRQGGLALVDTAQKRPVPIPVYAEMSSTNPVFMLPGALKQDVDALAEGYIASVTGSSGQLCTQPGHVFVPTTEDGDRFVEAVNRAVQKAEGQTMLTPGIADAWHAGTSQLSEQGDMNTLGQGEAGQTENAPAPVVYETDLASFVKNPDMQIEVFGAASVVIRYGDFGELVDSIAQLEGQLTTTLQMDVEDAGDLKAAADLLPALESLAGRILVNGWPTGVEVGHAMVHGGPYPATSDPRTTSVGSMAIERFLRPVAYQNLPEALLPDALKEANPWSLTRRVDGKTQLGEAENR